MEMVAVGSANIGRFDSIPLTLGLIRRACLNPNKLVDLGCGNAEYLLTYVDELPGVQVSGCEPSDHGFAAALHAIAQSRRASDLIVLQTSAQDYPLTADVDVIVLAFVLHEICGQSGEEAVSAFLSRVRQLSPNATIIVVEVNADLTQQQIDTPAGRGYYNAYHLLHPFTGQRLLTRDRWDDLLRKPVITSLQSVLLPQTSIQQGWN